MDLWPPEAARTRHMGPIKGSGESLELTFTKHDVVLGVSVHILLVQAGREELNVAPATVNVLLVLHSELDDQWLALVAEITKTGGKGVEAGVLAGLEAYMGKHNE